MPGASSPPMASTAKVKVMLVVALVPCSKEITTFAWPYASIVGRRLALSCGQQKGPWTFVRDPKSLKQVLRLKRLPQRLPWNRRPQERQTWCGRLSSPQFEHSAWLPKEIASCERRIPRREREILDFGTAIFVHPNKKAKGGAKEIAPEHEEGL